MASLTLSFEPSYLAAGACLKVYENYLEIATYFGIFRTLTRTCRGIVESYDYILTNQTLS